MPEQGRTQWEYRGGKMVKVSADADQGAAPAPAGGTPPADDVMTLREACAYLKISRNKLYRELKRGGVPGRRVGGTWRFSRRALLSWIEGGDTPDE